MDSMDNFRERFEALEQQMKVMAAHTRMAAQRLPWWLGIVCGVLLLSLVSLSYPSQAAEFSCPAGDVACLIADINTANGNGEANTINLAQGSYILTRPDNETDGSNGLPSITSTLTIKGNGPNLTSIFRDQGPPSVPPFRIFHVADTGELTLNGLTIGGGRAQQGATAFFSGSGGGIFIQDGGDATLNNVFLINNTASSVGGGISINGSIHDIPTIINSCICDNTALGENAISSGAGGGIFQGSPKIIDSLIQGNIALGAEGSIGGGISSVALTMTGSTVSFNMALGPRGDGGGIFTGGDTIIVNSTFSENSADRNGGGIYDGSGTLLINVTISSNKADSSGGGIFSVFPTTVKNTLLANNPLGGNCSGPFTSLGHNIASDGTCDLTNPTDQSGVNPLLGPLTFNGGPTPTHALLPGSPAIDAIPQTDCTDLNGQPLTTDQRGIARPQGGACDIGAFEFQVGGKRSRGKPIEN